MLSSFPFHLAVVVTILLVRFGPLRLARRSVRLQSAREACDTLATTLFVVFFLVQPFVAQAYEIPTGSLENSLPIGTRILASPLAPRFVPVRAGQALVFNPPTIALAVSGGKNGEVWVKRCIATPGQTVEMHKNVLWRDGKIVAEPYAIWASPSLPPICYDLKVVGQAVYSRTYDAMGRAGLWMQAGVAAPDQDAITQAASEKVPPDCFLMLGDHRNNSCDGHEWGLLRQERIVGRAFVSFWPPQQIGTITR